MTLRPARAGLLSSALLLLAACGGGGSDPMPVVQPFLVTAQVAGLPGLVLVPGFSTSVTMDSGNRLELSASPAGMQWTVTSDGNVIQAQASSDGARWSATLNSPKGGQLVIKAQSSADPSQQATLTVLVNAQRYARDDARLSESRSWHNTLTRNDGSSATSTTQSTVTVLNADTSHTAELRDIGAGVPGTLLQTASFDADFNRLSSQAAGGSLCTDAPRRQLFQFPLHYGQAWTSHWQTQCADGRQETADAATTVDDYASITVPQGTHDALHLNTHVVVTQSNDPALSAGSLGQADYTQDIGCWWSVTLKRTISCAVTTRYVGTAPPGYPRTETQDLVEAH